MATTRFDMRLDEKVKLKAEKASVLLGLKSLTEYVSKLMDEDSSRIIREHETMVVNDNIFDKFIKACEQVSEPNNSMKEALAFTRKRQIK